MRVLHFARSDGMGGAAKAAYRLHTALLAAGCSSEMIVREKVTPDANVIAAPIRSRVVWFRHATRNAPWRKDRRDVHMNTDYVPEVDFDSLLNVLPSAVDVVCIHSIWHLMTTAFIKKISDRFACPLIRVVMDQEAVTGGCHYSFDCDGYARNCGCCPQIKSDRPNDATRVLWNRKHELLAPLPFTFVAPTQQTAHWVQKSSLFKHHRIEEIGLAIDVRKFHPADPVPLRTKWGIPQDKKVLFFGSASLKDERKGMSYLIDALIQLADNPMMSSPYILVAGSEGQKLLSQVPFSYRDMGYINNDDDLAEAYQLSDLFVCPSVEDAGPMMIPESMLCGTPVVAFKSGGAPDLVVSGQTGYLAKYKDAADLSNGVRQVLMEPSPLSMRTAALQKALARHHPARVAEQHLEVYRSLQG